MHAYNPMKKDIMQILLRLCGSENLVDVFDVILAVIAIFSAIFVAITEGLKHTLGYRGSEETHNRKNRIDEKLQSEAQDKVQKFIEDCTSKKIDGETMQSKFEDLGYEVFVSRNLTKDILEASTRFMERGIKLLVITAIMLFFTSLMPWYYDLTDWLNLWIFLFYIVLTVFGFWTTISSVRKNYSLRKALISMDENATLENAIEVHGNLVNRGLL